MKIILLSLNKKFIYIKYVSKDFWNIMKVIRGKIKKDMMNSNGWSQRSSQKEYRLNLIKIIFS